MHRFGELCKDASLVAVGAQPGNGENRRGPLQLLPRNGQRFDHGFPSRARR